MEPQLEGISVLHRVAAWTGWPLSEFHLHQLEVFGRWLATEAVAAGGVGPHEGDRIASRHLADSLLFSAACPPPQPPGSVVDLGSGVGLPGIPLAVLWPTTPVTLVERSLRRVDLANRVRRIVGVDNLVVLATDAATVDVSADLVVGRGATHPDVFRTWASRIVRPGGRIVVGGSASRPAPSVAEGDSVLEVPSEILDRPAWLRMMAPS